jgi:exosortase
LKFYERIILFLGLDKRFSKASIVQLGSFLFASLILGLILFETFQDLNVLWAFNNQAYSHGYLVLGLVFYSLYERRDLLIYKPTFTTIPFAVLIGIAWTASNSVNLKLGEYLLLPAMLYLFITSYVGWKASVRFALPIAALYCALPIVGVLTHYLQALTVIVVTHLTTITGITAHIQGFFITLPHGVLHVASSCSGLSYLSAGVTFAMIYSFLNIRRKRIIAFSLLFIIALSLIANWVRVYILVLAAYQSEMQSSLVEKHGFLGWLIFAFVFMFYLFIMRKIENKYDKSENIESIYANSNESKLSGAVSKNHLISYALPVILAICIVLVPVYSGLGKQNQSSYAESNFAFPEFFARAGIEEYNNQDTVNFLGADESYKISDSYNDIPFNAYIIIYYTQEQGKELIYYKNKVGERLGVKQELVLNNISVNYAIERGATNKLVLWFYRVGEHEATSDIAVKATQLKYMFKPAPAQAYILKLECKIECEDTVRSGIIQNILEQVHNIKIAAL